ncbi:hypothetical protein [Streptomyces sp. Ru87]|uniref:hypothetical protein n=1 Tax=Streptomyces sp. Ru87 TaxID=2044307 RepID=UPI00117D786B|nr:hypothetical protein [Streptomyces sp. Ru87]
MSHAGAANGDEAATSHEGPARGDGAAGSHEGPANGGVAAVNGLPLLWLCGPSGVGKSTVGREIQQLLGRDGCPVGFVDADQLGLCYPAPDDDPETYRVKARNLAATVPVFRAAGVRCLVLAGGVHTLAAVRTYTDLLPDDVPVTLCRLRADLGELRERFVRRGWLTELADLIVREADELDRTGFADVCVDSSGLSVPETARLVLERTRGRLGGAAAAPASRSGPASVATSVSDSLSGSVSDCLATSVSDCLSGSASTSVSGSASGSASAPASGSVSAPAPGFGSAPGFASDPVLASATVPDPAGTAGAAPLPGPATAGVPPTVPVLWLCGPTAVGKSTAGWEVFVQIWRDDGIKAAYVDLQQIGFRLPAPADDPGNDRLAARNLAAMWPVFRAAGARCLVVSGGAADRSVVRAYEEALPGAALTVCRLRARPETLTERVLLRGRGAGPNIPGDALKGRPAGELRRIAREAVRAAEELERAGLGDLCVDTDGLSAADVARSVRARAAAAGPRAGGAGRTEDGGGEGRADRAGNGGGSRGAGRAGDTAGGGGSGTRAHDGGRAASGGRAAWPAGVSREARPGTRTASG